MANQQDKIAELQNKIGDLEFKVLACESEEGKRPDEIFNGFSFMALPTAKSPNAIFLAGPLISEITGSASSYISVQCIRTSGYCSITTLYFKNGKLSPYQRALVISKWTDDELKFDSFDSCQNERFKINLVKQNIEQVVTNGDKIGTDSCKEFTKLDRPVVLNASAALTPDTE